jgi:hypothetical protein
MKFGIRKINLKSSIKARTIGKAKRKVKKALIPGYGKKGTGWVTNPKKALYNKVYNKTSIGVGDIFSKILSSGSRTNNSRARSTSASQKHNSSGRNANDIISTYNRDLQILNDSAQIMKTTNNPDTFFSRYDLYMEKLHGLANAECEGIHFDGGSPSQKLAEVSREQAYIDTINGMIDRFWAKTEAKMETMKTERGRQNQVIKFREELSKYEPRMPRASIDYYKSKSE